ncbi:MULTISPECIES: haloacid dehalogenase type II [unclassified Pseudoalteromonas]|uniref:haloacid dehalogenase type II n=1 Tax=unclassified Pseudoalteromonas TaxID=194690 RepID=UPI000B3C02C5|nr:MULTISPECIES: haloacid dehalogenase type II [unclassified Pseudoalteromonas]MDN3377667.1 haloacid dehalogenase type II [Pseudoalteromonas sp. APC 3893]MDN3385863.1 haloacid dehalogenase type II [Pseudoalteromonas sp. APC 4017]OUS72837.1 haloacid dehalogenase, type II [Pseudoalteromonas sp. A601]
MTIFKSLTKLSLSLVLLGQLIGGDAMAAESVQPKPKVIIFDVNETLLDLNSMRESIGEALGGREDLLPLWFSTMLHHSLVSTAIGDYQDFGKIGVASLLMVAQNNDIKINAEQAKTAIVTPLLSLPAHPDVKAGLQALKDSGYKLVSLTNSSNNGVKAQFESAGLTDYFEARYSIEDIKIYKPDLRAYEWALKQLNVKAEDALMVAAHGWDVAGAKEAGLQTAFIARPGKALYPLAQKPDFNVQNLTELVELLK